VGVDRGSFRAGDHRHRPSTIDHRPSTIDHRPSTIAVTRHPPSPMSRTWRPQRPLAAPARPAGLGRPLGPCPGLPPRPPRLGCPHRVRAVATNPPTIRRPQQKHSGASSIPISPFPPKHATRPSASQQRRWPPTRQIRSWPTTFPEVRIAAVTGRSPSTRPRFQADRHGDRDHTPRPHTCRHPARRSRPAETHTPTDAPLRRNNDQNPNRGPTPSW